MKSPRKNKCPQCQISSFYIKNDLNERRLIYVLEDATIIPKYEEESLEGYDLTTVYCLGCSWSGTVKRLLK